MSTIKEHLDKIQDELDLLQRHGHVTEANEFSAVNEFENAIYKLRKIKETFERTKNIEQE